jgi:hypothetical protein
MQPTHAWCLAVKQADVDGWDSQPITMIKIINAAAGRVTHSSVYIQSSHQPGSKKEQASCWSASQIIPNEEEDVCCF